jgi:hypothetical protein
MTSSELLPATVLNRKAVVYVRQSTQSQVMTNLEAHEPHRCDACTQSAGDDHVRPPS